MITLRQFGGLHHFFTLHGGHTPMSGQNSKGLLCKDPLGGLELARGQASAAQMHITASLATVSNATSTDNSTATDRFVFEEEIHILFSAHANAECSTSPFWLT